MPYWDLDVKIHYWKEVNLALMFSNKAPGFNCTFFQRIDIKNLTCIARHYAHFG